jgi:hypothetical protein
MAHGWQKLTKDKYRVTEHVVFIFVVILSLRLMILVKLQKAPMNYSYETSRKKGKFPRRKILVLYTGLPWNIVGTIQCIPLHRGIDFGT